MAVLGRGAVVVLGGTCPLAPAACAGSRREVVAGGARQPLRVGVVEGQGVQRQVVGAEREGRLERRRPALLGAVRDVVQQVQRDRGNPRGPCRLDGPCHVLGSVPPAQPAELARVHRLRPERDPRDAGIAPRTSRRRARRDRGWPRASPRLRRSARTAPGSARGAARWRQVGAGTVCHRRSRRFPAAAATRERRKPGRAELQLRLEGGQERGNSVARPAGCRPGVDDEVAVRAERDAERDVDVQRDRRQRRCVGGMAAAVTDPAAPDPASRRSASPAAAGVAPRSPRPPGRAAAADRCGRCTGRPRSG